MVLLSARIHQQTVNTYCNHQSLGSPPSPLILPTILLLKDATWSPNRPRNRPYKSALTPPLYRKSRIARECQRRNRPARAHLIGIIEAKCTIVLEPSQSSIRCLFRLTLCHTDQLHQSTLNNSSHITWIHDMALMRAAIGPSRTGLTKPDATTYEKAKERAQNTWVYSII
jgi:hypothetical protein